MAKFLIIKMVLAMEKMGYKSSISLVSFTCQYKNVILMNRITNQYYKRNRPKVGCFAGFSCHHLVTMHIAILCWLKVE